jgi:hypothetical protein
MFPALGRNGDHRIEAEARESRAILKPPKAKM